MIWQRVCGLGSMFSLMAGLAAADNCSDRSTVIARLQSEYGEHLAMGGLQATNRSASMMEVWASDTTGTFTVLLTNPDGLTCIVAAGTDYFKAGPAQPEIEDISG